MEDLIWESHSAWRMDSYNAALWWYTKPKFKRLKQEHSICSVWQMGGWITSPPAQTRAGTGDANGGHFDGHIESPLRRCSKPAILGDAIWRTWNMMDVILKYYSEIEFWFLLWSFIHDERMFFVVMYREEMLSNHKFHCLHKLLTVILWN